MEPAVAIIILLITLIVVALAAFLIPVIVELGKINRGLESVLAGVGEIATKTAPVNGVLDAINVTLVAGRNLLEGLALKKAGSDAAGLVESCFPGEGARFLGRIGRSGAVVPIGEDYPRGAAILGSLLGGDAPPNGGAVTPQGGGAARPAAPAASPAGGGRISLRGGSAPSAAVAPPSVAGRLSAKGARPWE